MSSPQVVIDGVEQVNLLSFELNFSGGNQLNSCTMKISLPDFDENTLFGKIIELYLNNGAIDNIPIYRGIIKEVMTSETVITIMATDVRGLILGKQSADIQLTETNNYDGFSIGQFLKKHITDNINTSSKTFIGLDYLNDTSNLVNLTGQRGKFKALDLATTILQEEFDDTDNDNPLSYTFDIVEGPLYSNLVIKKQKLLKEQVAMNMSLTDGIAKYNYKRRPIASQVSVTDKTTDRLYTTKLGNSPQGPVSSSIKRKFNDPAQANKYAILHIKKLQQEVNEIKIDATKGHHLGLQSLVYISVGKDDIDGVHRLVSKNITYKDTKGYSLKLSFNKNPIKVSDYLSPQ